MPKHLAKTVLTFACAVGLIVACSDDPSALSESVLTPESESQLAVDQSHSVSILAKGIAAALANDSVRGQLLDDLRDSPFRRHAINFTSYIRSPKGEVLLEAASEGLGIDRAAFLSYTQGLTLQLVVPRVLDRIRWEGTEDVVLFGTALTVPQLMADSADPSTGYLTTGDSIQFNTYYGPSGKPLLALLPVTDRSLFVNPSHENENRGGTHRTISTPAEELRAMGHDEPDFTPQIVDPPCDPDLPSDDCAPTPGDPNPIPVLPAWTSASPTPTAGGRFGLIRRGTQTGMGFMTGARTPLRPRLNHSSSSTRVMCGGLGSRIMRFGSGTTARC